MVLTSPRGLDRCVLAAGTADRAVWSWVEAVVEVASDPDDRSYINKLAREFSQYHPEAILDGYICKLFGGTQAYLRRNKNTSYSMG